VFDAPGKDAGAEDRHDGRRGNSLVPKLDAGLGKVQRLGQAGDEQSRPAQIYVARYFRQGERPRGAGENETGGGVPSGIHGPGCLHAQGARKAQQVAQRHGPGRERQPVLVRAGGLIQAGVAIPDKLG
jgi:hypothetical protein